MPEPGGQGGHWPPPQYLADQLTLFQPWGADSKGQLNSERIFEVIVSPTMPTKNYKDFCPTKQTRIVAKKNLPTITKKSPKKVLRSLFVW